MWRLHLIPLKKIAFVHINDQLKTDKTVVFTDSCLPSVVIIDKQIEVNEIKSENDLQLLLQNLDSFKICKGVNNCRQSKLCVRFFDPSLTSPRIVRCSNCASERRKLQKVKSKNLTPAKKLQRLTRKLKTKH